MDFGIALLSPAGMLVIMDQHIWGLIMEKARADGLSPNLTARWVTHVMSN